MNVEAPGLGDSAAPLDLSMVLPFEPEIASDRLGWVGLDAARFGPERPFELDAPALGHHRVVLVGGAPDELELYYDGAKRYVPPPTGSITLVPAGCEARLRTSGCRGALHIFLEPRFIARVAAEAFELDPARVTIPWLYGLDLPHIRAAMGAVDAELTSGGAGGGLAAESLANVLAVHLIRHVMAPRRPARGRDGALPRGRLRAVVEYIEGHLDASPRLEQMAAVARLSPYHFARQFKTATGLPPYQFVIARRIERAKHLMQDGVDFSLAQVAVRAGFADQSQFSRHFKRLVGVTPGQFRTPARID
jgi:AraC family transcriptional regulator